MDLVIIGVGGVNIVHSWLLSESVSIVKSSLIGGLEAKPVVPWLFVLASVLSLLVESSSLSLRDLDLRVFVNVFRGSWVLVGHIMSSLVNMGIYVHSSWLLTEVVGIELIVVDLRVAEVTPVLVVSLLDCSLGNLSRTSSDWVFPVSIESLSFANVHIYGVLLVVSWIVCSTALASGFTLPSKAS
jgi:hypothetical protein